MGPRAGSSKRKRALFVRLRHSFFECAVARLGAQCRVGSDRRFERRDAGNRLGRAEQRCTHILTSASVMLTSRGPRLLTVASHSRRSSTGSGSRTRGSTASMRSMALSF